MKVAFENGIDSRIDATRGIGVHTNELIKYLRKYITVVSEDSKADIVHYTKFSPFFISLPFLKPAKKVILTIHDLIPLLYPKHYPPGVFGRINFLINKFLIWKNVDEIITISETSKKDICRFLNINPEKVHVIYLAPKKVFKKIKNPTYSGLPKKFILYVGDVNYNKNIPTLIEASKKTKMPLVIAGKQAAEIENLDLRHPELTHLKNLDWKDVIRLGFVSDETLVNIYNLASVYVQPSFYEGFGLGVLEAMACETPVIASRTQALVEIAEGACVFFDPKDEADLANEIIEVTQNNTLRNQLIETGKMLFKNYSWEKCAQETLEIYGH